MWLKFIMGVVPIDSFDNYLDELNNLGLQELIEYEELAVSRYDMR